MADKRNKIGLFMSGYLIYRNNQKQLNKEVASHAAEAGNWHYSRKGGIDELSNI